jgi:ribosomal protein L37AE/L43A
VEVAEQGRLKCDFCGRTAEHVRRVALDRGYDRLGQRHAVRYACPDCSRRKDAQRRESGDPGRSAGG